MFSSEEEKQKSLDELNASIKNFNKNFSVNADVSVFDSAKNKNSANAIFINAFENLLKQAIKNESSSSKIRLVSMRAAFERDVVGPYRKHCIDGATENDLAKVKRKLPDVDAGLNSSDWWRQIDKSLDGIFWEKIDNVVDNYKNGPLRIRDMVAETKRILAENRSISNEETLLVATYAAALKRANETRRGIWKLLSHFRAKAELRESANIEKMLNERLGDADAYRNALKNITDPTGKIETLKSESRTNQGVLFNFSAALKANTKAEKTEKHKPQRIEEEKEPLEIDDDVTAVQIKTENPIPGNERLYNALKNKSFENQIKEEIWKALKLKESLTLDKNTVIEDIYKPLLSSVKSINESHFNLVNSGADNEALNENLDDLVTNLYSEAYLNLKSLNLPMVDRVVAAQKICNTMLNNLSVVGFEKERFGKYGDSYAVKNKTDDVLELLQFQNASSTEEINQRAIELATRELNVFQKQRVKIFDYEKGTALSEKAEVKSSAELTKVK